VIKKDDYMPSVRKVGDAFYAGKPLKAWSIASGYDGFTMRKSRNGPRGRPGT
jgi:hypothetical protein